MATHIRSLATPQNHHSAAEAIAKETDTAVHEVEKLYEQELTQLAGEARITQYLGVLASKRVRMRLRKHCPLHESDCTQRDAGGDDWDMGRAGSRTNA